MTFRKLPRKVRRFLIKHALLTDFLTFFITYITLGSSLTALTAGAIVAVMTSALCYVLENENDFLYLYDMKNMILDKIQWIKNELNTYGTQYREEKLAAAKQCSTTILESSLANN